MYTSTLIIFSAYKHLELSTTKKKNTFLLNKKCTLKIIPFLVAAGDWGFNLVQGGKEKDQHEDVDQRRKCDDS